MTAIHFPTIVNNAPVISRMGTDDVFVELSFRRLSDKGGWVELVATRVEYNAFSGRYLRDELGREVVEEEDAENAATDLSRIAQNNLYETNDRGTCDPCSFEDAVWHELDALYAVAAE